jgi:hypothetical protein
MSSPCKSISNVRDFVSPLLILKYLFACIVFNIPNYIPATCFYLEIRALYQHVCNIRDVFCFLLLCVGEGLYLRAVILMSFVCVLIVPALRGGGAGGGLLASLIFTPLPLGTPINRDLGTQWPGVFRLLATAKSIGGIINEIRP